MKSIKNIICIAGMFILTSCHSQDRKDLEAVKFNEDNEVIFKNIKTLREKREINTTLPMISTYQALNFRFGSVNFLKNEETNTFFNIVGLFLNSSEDKIMGVYANIEDNHKSIEILEYLTQKYGKPKILAPIPKKKNGTQMGYAAFLWDLPKMNKFIIISQSYEEFNKKSKIATLLYMVDDTVKVTDPDDERTVKERLIKTYTP